MWKPGETGNPKGRPKGAKGKPPVLTAGQKKRLLESLYARATEGDPTAQDELFLFWQMQELQTGAQA